MKKTTCQGCKRTVLVLSVGGRDIATDPEVMSTVPHGGRQTVQHARRVHAELCESYQQAAQRQKIAAELREYNLKHGLPDPTSAPARTRRKNFGL